MIDVKEGNNILYLPLDQIAATSLDPNRRSRDENPSSTTSTTLGSDIQAITDRVIEELRRRRIEGNMKSLNLNIGIIALIIIVILSNAIYIVNDKQTAIL